MSYLQLIAPAQKLLNEAFWAAEVERADANTADNAGSNASDGSGGAPVERLTFAPGTSMTTFSEQSRTTFRHVPGASPSYCLNRKSASPRGPTKFLQKSARKPVRSASSSTASFAIGG